MRPSSRMLKKPSSGVLAALRVSTYRSVRLTSSLAAALPDGFLSILRSVLLLSQRSRPFSFQWTISQPPYAR